MFHRPLVPVLFSFVGGILLGHIGFLRDSSPPFSLLLLVILSISLLLIAALLLPEKLRFFCFLPLFFFTGLYLDLHEHRDSELLLLASRGEEVTIEGVLTEPAKIIGESSRLVMRADRVSVKGAVTEPGEKIQVTVYSHSREFSPQDKILFPARLRPFRNFNNPGRYDHEMAMMMKGLRCAASVSDGRRIVPMGKGHLGFPMELLESARGPLRAFFRERLTPQNRALFQALILGETHGITPELREPFTITGLGHILAVSGLNVGMVAGIAFALFRMLLSFSYRLSLATDIRKLAAILTCLPVVGYTCLAGFEVSSQRAMVMVLAFLLSMILDREKEVWSTFSLSALIVLALDPHALFSISFQLSFGAVTGILWFVPEIYKRLIAPLNGDLKEGARPNRIAIYLAALVATSFAPMVFVLPLIAHYFNRISVVALPANLMVVPFMGVWIMPLGLLAVISLPVSSSLANFFLQLCAWGQDWMMLLIEFWSRFSWAEFWVVTPNLLEMGIFYGLIICTFSLKRWRWAWVGLTGLLLILAVDVAYWISETQFNRSLKVTYLDVGQGSATLIQFPGNERMLIDGGGFQRSDFDVGKLVVAPFLFHSKILSIDHVVMSHPDSDHMDGLRFIASHFGPREFWYNGDSVESESYTDLMGIVETKGIIQRLPADLKDGRDISGARVELLHPVPDENGEALFAGATKLNDRSMVLKVSYGRTSCLFPGDLERLGEEMVIWRAGPLLKSDVLLAGHHGSRSSSSEDFLAWVKPRLCIISSRSSNVYRFPHPATLRRLEEAGCSILRIDQVGAVSLVMGPDRFEVSTFLTGPLQTEKE